MRINLYYGGRGVIDDPTIYVLDRFEEVLKELNVQTYRYNIHDNKHEIFTLPHSINNADGIVLATTVEWLGIGGYMTQFLDACWQYSDKEKLSKIYMQPIVLSTTYGEREGMLTLENAWEILGGRLVSGLSGYVEDLYEFKQSMDYLHVIERKAEDLYRAISKKRTGLPTSNRAVTQTILKTQSLHLTPQETEQLSEIAADDSKVRQQKEDVLELSRMYENIMRGADEDMRTEFIKDFSVSFVPQEDFTGSYPFQIEGKEKLLFVRISDDKLRCHYVRDEDADVRISLTHEVMNDIVAGRMTFQRAFSVGEMSAKGNFNLIAKLDEAFIF